MDAVVAFFSITPSYYWVKLLVLLILLALLLGACVGTFNAARECRGDARAWSSLLFLIVCGVTCFVGYSFFQFIGLWIELIRVSQS